MCMYNGDILSNVVKYKKIGQKLPLRGHLDVIAEVNDLRFENFLNLRVDHI